MPDTWKRKGRCRNGAALSDARWGTLHKVSGWERCAQNPLHLLLPARQAVQLRVPLNRWSPTAVWRLARNAGSLLHKLKKSPRIPPHERVRILGDFRLSGLLLFLCVFFFCEEQFNIFLCLYQLLHFFSCLAIVRVGCFLLGQKIGILCIQCFDLRQLF